MCKRVCSCWSFGHASVRVGCWSVGLSWCPSACCRLSYDTLHCGYSVVSCGRGRCAARTSCSGLPAAGAMHGGDGETRWGGPSLAAGPRGGAACDVAGGLQPQLCVEAAAFGTRAGSNIQHPWDAAPGTAEPSSGPSCRHLAQSASPAVKGFPAFSLLVPVPTGEDKHPCHLPHCPLNHLVLVVPQHQGCPHPAAPGTRPLSLREARRRVCVARPQPGERRRGGVDGVVRRKWGVRRTMARRDWWGEKSAGRAVEGTLSLAGVDPVFLSPKFSKPREAGLGE